MPDACLLHRRRAYWLNAATGFLFACATQQCSLLSVILHKIGTPDHVMGYVLAATSVPVIIATLVSGWLLTRFEPSRVALVGVATALIGFMSMEFTVASVPL